MTPRQPNERAHHRHRRSIQLREDRAGQTACPELPGTSIVSLDSYYLGMEEIPLEERKKANFDHPDSLDWPLLHRHLQAIAAGRAFDEPVYSFADYARTTQTRRIGPAIS